MTLKRNVAVSYVFLLAFLGLISSTSRVAITIILVTRGRAIDYEDAYESGYQFLLIILDLFKRENSRGVHNGRHGGSTRASE
ncbi:predicted protein [Sclerotinia sclerotiorum 1980 UF-70]|uniref:Uncharacterized protein n=1 Tax=Sclerotinia sclerotiorum (strain ATCC 18683 / 1980 / Ss-1) TaxID=665079 RepID=A7EPF1_SCLS1|nr:predicted protein [Sclerotinia sclerotiorum 1980 UF-70]EDO04717.1 predicted protein [Sclerotinia sclerotiorum 1980 UF-70]